MKAKVLVTGGSGFIGAHTAVELIHSGYEPVIVDNLSNSEFFMLNRVEALTGFKPLFYAFDLCDETAVQRLFAAHNDFSAVIHFAAFKAVEESVRCPLKYFNNNLLSLLNVVSAMEGTTCKNLLFSSSATVYGDPDNLPVTEDAPFKKSPSAYGSTKQMGEDIIEKAAAAGRVKSIALRYFNAVGAHPSGLIGELPLGVPNNLMPFITQAAAGKLQELVVYGQDYDTPDGTCIRDYIHVVDVAKAHVKACEYLLQHDRSSLFEAFNIGTGKGYSVLEVIQRFREKTGVTVPYTIGKRRAGDAPANFADVSKAADILHWKAALNLDDMVTDSWRWQVTLNELKKVTMPANRDLLAAL